MKIKSPLLILVPLCLIITVGSYFLSALLTDSFAVYRSVLRDSPPTPGEPVGPPATRRLVWVLIDALRIDTADNTEVMPEFNRLRSQGASATMHSRPPAFSSPGWGTMLTGAWPDINDSMPLSPDYETLWPWTQDHLFAAVRRTGRPVGVSGYYWLEKFLWNEPVEGHYYTPHEDHAADVAVVEAAMPWLDDPSYAFVFIHLDQIDYAGHNEGGPLDPAWNAAAARADGLLGQIVSRLDLSRDTLLVCADHGHIDQGGHGGDEPFIMTEPFFLLGAGVKPGQYGEIAMADLAPTVAALLGTNLPASSQGRVLTEMVQLPDETLSNLPAATAAQQSLLLHTYAAAIGEPLRKEPLATGDTAIYQQVLAKLRQSRLNRERGLRALAAMPVFLALSWLFFRWQKGEVLIYLAGAGIYLALFHVRFSIVDRWPYSFSTIVDSVSFTLYVGLTTALILIPLWALGGWRLGVFQGRPALAAGQTLRLVFAVFYLLALPIAFNLIWNGPAVGWTLPEMGPHFYALLAGVQVLMVGGLGLLLTGAAAGVAKFIYPG